MATDQPTVALADGHPMPLVGFGTWRLRGPEAYEATRYALEIGYRHLDTATLYANEAEVGRAVRDSGVPREEIFIVTKLRPGDAGLEHRVLEASLRDLDCGWLDLWLIHSPPADNAGLPSWREFLAAREQGLVRSVGVSNYDPDQLDLLAQKTGQMPMVNQIPWSPKQFDPDVLAGHQQRRVVLEGYSPLKNTRLDDPVLTAIADRHGVSTAQVVLRWHLEHEIPVIPKSGRRERIASNLDVFGFTLSADEVARIDAL